MNRRDFLRTAGGAAGGTAALAASGSASAAESGGGGGGGSTRPQWPSYVSDADNQGYQDLRDQDEVTISVDSNFFDPTFIWVSPETTITWSFDASGHNVKFNSQPEGAELAGTAGGEFDVIETGQTHSVTPTTGGIYTYYCGPHEGQGMKGAIAVGDDVSTQTVGGGGGGGEPNPEHMGVPFQAHFVGLATLLMIGVSYVFTFFFLKYGESSHTKGGSN
ncbi:plastocyanin/azurin family copper-binding protein [Halapricum salinum]|uniref:Halocyanin n=1 Tax=Halapricum salinum TaxID=1457250 RepID=A0A4D6H7H6_9EURY|nr:plastocyanin/azurin family copper-binding protein [Halapricum salinum]QCC49753.1 halocyanin [Halapricum salinum]